jgi:hypothetical protein
MEKLFGVSKKPAPEKTEQIKSKGRRPVLEPFVSERFEIRLRYKGKLYKAIVRKDGSILCKGQSYNSPSLAAHAIKGRATNGWMNWHYERAPGDWVALDTLRRK